MVFCSFDDFWKWLLMTTLSQLVLPPGWPPLKSPDRFLQCRPRPCPFHCPRLKIDRRLPLEWVANVKHIDDRGRLFEHLLAPPFLSFSHLQLCGNLDPNMRETWWTYVNANERSGGTLCNEALSSGEPKPIFCRRDKVASLQWHLLGHLDRCHSSCR